MIQELLPPRLEVDVLDGKAWVGLVPSAWVPSRDPISPKIKIIGNLRDSVFAPKVGTDGSGG